MPRGDNAKLGKRGFQPKVNRSSIPTSASPLRNEPSGRVSKKDQIPGWENHPLLQGRFGDIEITFTYDPNQGSDTITARNASGEQVGYMAWNKRTGTIQNVSVPDFALRRRGIATRMWAIANMLAEHRVTKKPKHSSMRTDIGEAWAQSIGGVIPLNRLK